MIEDGLYAHLIAYAGLAALIGDRVYPLKAPQDAIYPLLNYQRISGPRVHSHNGPSGLAHPRFQLTAWASSLIEAKLVVAQARAAVDGFKGTMGDVDINGCFVVNEIDHYDPETERHGTTIDVIIWHNE